MCAPYATLPAASPRPCYSVTIHKEKDIRCVEVRVDIMFAGKAKIVLLWERWWQGLLYVWFADEVGQIGRQKVEALCEAEGSVGVSLGNAD